LVLLAGLILTLLGAASAQAGHVAGGGTDLVGPGYLCPPRLQLRHPARCPPVGPSSDLAELARRGMYPIRPLPTLVADPSLGKVPHRYVRLGTGNTPLYDSSREAAAGGKTSQSIEPGFKFASWRDCQVISGVAVYRIRSGKYVRGGETCAAVALSRFRGLAFSRTPDRPFAWVLARARPSRAPGMDPPETGPWLDRYEVVQIFDEVRVGNWSWYQVGPHAWIEQRLLGVVTPDPARPTGVEDNRWISINLYEQTLAVYEDGNLVYATLVSSGRRNRSTRQGVFQVWAKLERTRMSLAFESDRSDFYYLEDVPWVLYFDRAIALHGTYWHNGFGYRRSAGCVNLSPADAEWVFLWAEQGTWVHVWDPSGHAPVAAGPAEGG
jgi:hypothetical protein